MKVFILGVGDAFAAQNYNTCFIVQSTDGFNLAVECPHPYLKILDDVRKINKDVPYIHEIDNFIVTHLHSDHCGGLETLGFYKKFIESKKLGVRMHWNDMRDHEAVIAPSMGRTLVDNKIVKLDSFDYFDYTTIDGRIGPFTVESRTTHHYIPAQALIVREGDKSIAFSSDTAFDRDLVDWLGQAGFILHETGPAPGHTPLEQLTGLPQQLRRKIRLIHYNDSISTRDFRKAQQGEVIHI